MSTPLLELTDLAPERAIVRIYGADYEMNEVSDLTPRLQARFDRAWAVARRWMTTPVEDRTDEFADEYDAALKTVVPIILRDLPVDVSDRLSATERNQVAFAFLERMLAPLTTETKTPRRTGGKSSRASKPATAARTRSGG